MNEYKTNEQKPYIKGCHACNQKADDLIEFCKRNIFGDRE